MLWRTFWYLGYLLVFQYNLMYFEVLLVSLSYLLVHIGTSRYFEVLCDTFEILQGTSRCVKVFSVFRVILVFWCNLRYF